MEQIPWDVVEKLNSVPHGTASIIRWADDFRELIGIGIIISFISLLTMFAIK